MQVWLASYPRSGNTLLRTMIHDVFGYKTISIYKDKDINDDTKNRLGFVDDVYTSDVTFIKTHELPTDQNRAIYVVRDGRCATISYWHYTLKFTPLINTTYTQICKGLPNGISWSDHVIGWSNRALLIRYEDMLTKPSHVIEVISKYCGIQPKTTWINPWAELHNADPNFFRNGSDNATLSEFNALPNDKQDTFWKYHTKVMKELNYIN